jgi:outer membrane immunogenic protein
VPPPFTWTGFYVGLNAGGGWASHSNNNNNVFPFLGAVPLGTFAPVATHNSSNGGFVGGIQGGYNYQFGVGSGFVLGIEADIDYANIGRNHSATFPAFTLPQFPGTIFAPTAGVSNNNSNQYLGTVRLRAGYAWDRFLVYATGGLAYGGINNAGVGAGVTALTAPGFVVPTTGLVATVPTTSVVGVAANRSSSTHAGWTLGAGVEYAWTNNWTVKAEYLYANFDANRNAPGFFLPGVAAAFNNRSHSIDVNIVRLGVNYKFW